MSLVSLNGVAVSFGALDVLTDVNCEVGAGDSIGLVGRNGAGKTTLLRILAGSLASTSGHRRGARGLRVSLVEQVPAISSRTTVQEEATSGAREMVELERALERAAHDLASSASKEAADAYADLDRRFESSGGFRYRLLVDEVLAGLGFRREKRHQSVSHLSGGERNRLGLARALVAQPDLLLMDEPTNHLDLDGLRWLETFLGRWRGSLVVTSHDRYFLDQVATRIWHLDDGRLRTYPGDYSKSEDLRLAELQRQREEYDKQQEFLAKEEAFIRRYRAGQRAREARGRRKRLERVERLEAPKNEGQLRLRLGARRSGRLVLSAHEAGVGYGRRTVLWVGDLEVERRDRVALLGPNGTGKSTLLRTIAGELEPVAGEFSLGAGVRPTHYWQEAEDLDLRSTVLDELLRARNLDLQDARDLLGRFLFSGDEVAKPVSALSGGERSRLALARLVLADASLLLLDEPTNHLDIPSREALEEALSSYEGTIIFASHDRRLIQRLASKLWLVEGGKISTFDGSLDEYNLSKEKNKERAADRRRRPESRRPPEPAKTRKRRDDELGVLEAEIEKCEQELAALGDRINSASARGDVNEVRTLGERFKEQREEADRLLEEWALRHDADAE